VIHKDIFNGFKAAEFTVYDRSEKQVHYRLESDYGLTQTIKVIKRPSKEEIGRLKGKVHLFLYEAEISILNPETNKWDCGSIEQNFKLMGNSFNINWNGHRIKVETKAFSLITNFYDEDRELLAQIQRKSFIGFRRKHNLKIFSDEYPKEIYLLGLVAYDRLSAAKGKG
jgi:hypothetical protein